MGKTKVVLDTNILISALGWEGNPRKILNIIQEDKIEALTSQEQIAELSRVLDYPRLQFSDEQKKSIKTIISSLFTFIQPTEHFNIIKEDPDDNIILECAKAGKADCIISGDPHLLNLKEFDSIKIKTPAQFLKDFRERT